MHSQNHWGGTFDIDGAEDDQSRNMDIDRGALQHQHQLDETQQSWLLGPPEAKKKDRYVDLGCVVVKRKLLWWMLWAVLGAFVLIGVPIIIAKNIPKKKAHAPPPDKYTDALHKALLFFNAQKSGKLPKNNGIPWRGNSGMKDGADLPDVKGGLVGGYYDAGDNIKFHFPMAFSMTLLSWSVVEYADRYKAIGEYDHVRELIKWGTDYLLLTFNSSASTINKLYSQVGTAKINGSTPDDHYCWNRPEDMAYPRPVQQASAAPDLGGEVAAALASASIVFRDNAAYSKKLVRGAATVYKFARANGKRTPYSRGNPAIEYYYNSTSYWDEFMWSASWMYYATGNNSYISFATDPRLPKNAKAFFNILDFSVFSWDNKLPGATLLLSRLFDLEDASGKVKVVKVEAKKKEGKKKEGKKKKAEEKKAEAAAVEEKKEEAVAEEKKEDGEAKKEDVAAPAVVKKEEEAKEEVVAEPAEEKKEEAVAEEEKKEEAEPVKEKEETAAAEEEAVEGEKAAAVVVDKDVSLWGVPLLPSKGDDATDVVLLKFLRARDFKAGAAFEMLRRTLRWRREWKSLAATAADGDEDEADTLPEGACYLDGADREGHPVCYNALGVFGDEAVYKSALGTDGGKKPARFLRWRVRAMERHVAELDFTPGGAASLLQVTDLCRSPGPAKKDLRVAMKQVLDLFQDNYPELVARNILINVPFSYYAFSTILFPFMTQRTKSKLVVARPSKVTETLLKYIPIEAIPVKYGGLKRDGEDTEFSGEQDAEIAEVVVKANSTETIEIEAAEGDTTLTWDLTVLGWEVRYTEEFVPADEGAYTIVVSKGRKVGAGEEAVRNSFRAAEAGKVVITVENATRGRKRVLFRHRAKSALAKKC